MKRGPVQAVFHRRCRRGAAPAWWGSRRWCRAGCSVRPSRPFRPDAWGGHPAGRAGPTRCSHRARPGEGTGRRCGMDNPGAGAVRGRLDRRDALG